MRATILLLILCGTLRADVVILKGGAQVSGRVVKKTRHIEVRTTGGLRTFLPEEVERIIKDPKELLGDAEMLYEQAKKEFLANNDASAIAKVTRARETYASTRELFPESKYDYLDKRLVQVMQLLRMLRGRQVSKFARRPGYRRAAPTLGMADAFAILRDPVERAKLDRRNSARNSFQALRMEREELYGPATAAMAFLGRPENLPADAAEAFKQYFATPWLQDPFTLTPPKHLEASRFLADRIAGLSTHCEALLLFAAGHLGHAPAGADAEAAARKLGFTLRDGRMGTPEGHAVADLSHWIANKDFDLAVLAFKTTHRKTDTPVVRFVWSYALLRLVQEKQRGWERPVKVMKAIRTKNVAFRGHLAALAKSIEAVASCNACLGQARLRCTNCHGKKEIRYDCPKCKGSGKKVPAPSLRGFRFGGDSNLPCYPCRGRGFTKKIVCRKCTDGTIDCKQCKAEAYPPEMSEIVASERPCGACEGRGTLFRKVLWACPDCRGLGLMLTPQSDPTKVLID